MSRIIVPWSGGADSTTLLYQMLSLFGPGNVQPIYFKYGQRHGPGEQAAIKNISKRIDVQVEFLSFDLTPFGRSPLTDLTQAVPTQAEHRQSNTVVPFRNTMFLVLAAAYATIHNYDCITVGACREDLPEYPDCRPEYFEAMQHALRLADKHYHLEISYPYAQLWKKEIIKLGVKCAVPYELTHTCYKGRYQEPCRECDACKEREKSFEDNGLVDPLINET